MAEETNNNEIPMMFGAVDPVLEVLVESPKETATGSSWVRWGDKNTYPQYIDSLCKDAPTLRSCILGSIDYVCGNSVTAVRGLQGEFFDRKRTTAKKLVKATAKSILKWGGFAWKVTMNKGLDTIAEIENIPVKFLRTDEDCTTFWYNEKWGKGYKTTEYPAWMAGTNVAESIYFVKVWGDGTYPEPLFCASVKDAEIERGIAEYHLGSLTRGFMGSYLVNFNNGSNISDDNKKKIEKAFTEKFAGKSNAGRIMFSFNPNVQNRTTLEKMEITDYGEKYQTLKDASRQGIFTAFRAHPTLFGLAESSGFNQEEYDGAFRLFNRTLIQPIQQEIVDAFEAVLGRGAIVIEPFTLDGATNNVQ